MGDYDLTDEDQIKQYLQNIETEYSYQCLSENEPDGCHRLADFMDSIRNNPEVGGKLFKKNCDENQYGLSCFKYAGKRMLGKGLSVDGNEGVKYFEKACEYGIGRGCSNAGMIYLEGRGVDKNLQKGLHYISKACEQDRADSCAVLGTSYLLGHYGLSRNIEKAQLLLGKACDRGSMQGCVNLSRMYKVGDGVKPNGALAEKYKQAAIKIKQQTSDTNRPTVSLGRES